MNSVKSKYFKKYIINLNKLSEMSKLKERFLKEKLNLIEKQENDYYNLFKNYKNPFEIKHLSSYIFKIYLINYYFDLILSLTKNNRN